MKLDSDESTLVVTVKDNKNMTVTVNKDAKITLDGKAAKFSCLKAPQRAKMTHEDNEAIVVEAKSGDKK